MQGNWFCIIVIIAFVSLTLPHTVTPLTHRRGRMFSMTGAAETRSPGGQMRTMSPPGDWMSSHGWSVWGTMNSLGFEWNISEWKRTDDSTDALISYVCVANIALSIVTVKKSYRVMPWFGLFCYTSWEGMIKTFAIDSYCLRTTFRGEHSEISIY